jgi:hypothetical protein
LAAITTITDKFGFKKALACTVINLIYIVIVTVCNSEIAGIDLGTLAGGTFDSVSSFISLN